MTTDLRFLRQLDAVNMAKLANLQVTLIGAGSIGSTTALWLSKMGLQHLRIFDADTVEQHNWSNQMFRATDIGKFKVEALAEVLKELAEVEVEAHIEDYVDQPLTEVVISGVDSMASRKAIWKSVRSNPDVKLYLDARMGLETLVVYAVHPQIREERQAYVKSLYSDESATQEPCTARTICYTPLMASSILCSMVKRFVNGEQIPKSVILDLVTWTMIG